MFQALRIHTPLKKRDAATSILPRCYLSSFIKLLRQKAVIDIRGRLFPDRLKLLLIDYRGRAHLLLCRLVRDIYLNEPPVKLAQVRVATDINRIRLVCAGLGFVRQS